MQNEKLKLRPYARLLTMLGDQLIKNEKIALVELIKNAYDADADWVEIRFENFTSDMSIIENSRIVVRDNGCGMTLDTIRDQWMNPAAPKKYLEKQDGTGETPKKKRIMQGEKGIGRFAILKLGRVIEITTRAEGDDIVTRLTYDFSRFDDDFLYQDGQREADIFLDDIEIEYVQFQPIELSTENHGTEIEISNLKGEWNHDLIWELCRDIDSLIDPVSQITGPDKNKEHFDIRIYCNDEPQNYDIGRIATLRSLIEDKSVLDIKGYYNFVERKFYFQNNTGNEEEVSLNDPKIKGLWIWKNVVERKRKASRRFECGNFKFQFYIFDFSRGIDGRHALSTIEKSLLKNHRIYLYRDDMRVYPYGDPDDDWLSIDVDRGTGRAGDFFSNDQVVGWVEITQKGNPELRDKTNREGLIETRGVAEDFKLLVRTFLSYIKQHNYSRHQIRQEERKQYQLIQEETVAHHLADLRESLEKLGNKSCISKIKMIETRYNKEKQYLSSRIEITRDLAGVGLSVEMASHDIMLMMSRAQEIGIHLAQLVREKQFNTIQTIVDLLLEVLHQIMEGMRDVQSLFKSSRRRRKMLEVIPILDKIQKIYSGLMNSTGIHYRMELKGSSSLEVKSTDGVIMQVLINLFDNSCYWLGTVNPSVREICVTVDGERKELIFSDNGPGIDAEDLPYIFEPFYSGKGQEGRGLGLYITRQLLEGHGFQISVAESEQNILPGANFVISFIEEQEL